jgi:outer membrane lipopolysaccharide assembly protein LptE/RlpB
MMKRIFALFAVLCSMFIAAGCGYTTRSMISNKFKTIYVTPFVNKIDIAQEAYTANKYKIYRPTLETDITKSVTDKFIFDGNLRPTKEESADLILKGELIEFRRDPLRYDNNDEVTEYRLNLLVNISLLDAKQNKLVWQENGFTGDTTYFTTGSQAKSETTAINDAIADLSRRIIERTVEQW